MKCVGSRGRKSILDVKELEKLCHNPDTETSGRKSGSLATLAKGHSKIIDGLSGDSEVARLFSTKLEATLPLVLSFFH